MGIKKLSPTSPARRYQTYLTNDDITADKPHKPLLVSKKRTDGRNNLGKMTVRHRGGGHKQRYRFVDFKRRKAGAATVERLEYDPNRSAFIALVKYQDGTLSYILAPQRIQAGDTVEAGEKADIKPGNALPLSNIPVGTIVHNIELKMGSGGQLCRSAGTYAQIIGRDQGMAQLRLRLRVVRARHNPQPGVERTRAQHHPAVVRIRVQRGNETACPLDTSAAQHLVLRRVPLDMFMAQLF